MFSDPSSDFLKKVKKDLYSYWGHPFDPNRVVSFKGKNWFIKITDDPDESKRDLLAFTLGGSWLNIAEVKILSLQERIVLDEFRTGLQILTRNTWLVRLAQDYKLDDVPIKNLDDATAGELVFSIWIRRRDAHLSNKALTEGIPIFFDFGAAFTAESQSINLDGFFRQGGDSGYAGNWRLIILQKDQLFNLNDLRKKESRKPISLQVINNESVFLESLTKFGNVISSQNSKSLISQVRKCSFNDQESQKIINLLLNSRALINNGIKQMIPILKLPYEPNP